MFNAKYLFRLDDANHYLDSEKWDRIEKIFDKFSIKPIVAVVPANRDRDLMISKYNPNFWLLVKKWEEKGWSIAVHGLNHKFHKVSRRSLRLPFYNFSEFGGLNFEKQRKKIKEAIDIFKNNELNPRIWISPAHSYDSNTLKAIEAETNIKIISDGIAFSSYFEKGFNFIPQQTWTVKKRMFGLWTICLHPNNMLDEDFKKLEANLKKNDFHKNVITFDEVPISKNKKSFFDILYSNYFWVKYNFKILVRPNSLNLASKKSLMIVGSFPKGNKKIYGGIAKSSEILLESDSFKKFDIIKFDSSQISHPPPNIIIRSILALLRIIKFFVINTLKKPDAILIFCADGGSALEKGIMVLIAKLLNIRAYIFPRAGNLINQTKDSTLMLILIRFLFKKADLFFCQGLKWVKFASYELNIESNKIKTVSNWSATNELLAIGEKRKINSSKSSLKIIYLGWLEKEKGIIELIKSFNQICKSNPDIQLTLIGDGSLNKYIENFKIKNNLNGKLILKGWLPKNKVKDYLFESDIFVLPSWQEGMPNALIEALASGLPSITTSVGVIPDYLINNNSALIVEPKNLNKLKKSIEKLINDNNLREKLSKNGLLVAKENFSTTKSLDSFSKFILQTLN